MPILRSAALTCLLTSAAAAQSALVTVVRGDTMQIEKFTRTATRLDGEVTPKGGARLVFSSRIESDGRLRAMTLAAYAPGARADATPLATGEITFAGDTVLVANSAGGGTPQVQRVASTRLAQPILNTSLSVFEVLLEAARRGGAAEASASVFLVFGGQTIPVTFARLSSDSVAAMIGQTAVWLVTDTSGRLLRAGIPSQGAAITRVDGVAASKIGFVKPDYSAPAGAPYTAESVTVPTPAGHTLGGTFTKPVGDGATWPVAISITGSGAQDRDEFVGVVPNGYRLFRQVADTLGRRGIAMLRMDDRGYGESGGAFATATSRDFANDIRAAIAYLRTRPDVDAARIFLIGHSEGGMIAPMVALDEPALAGLVLMAGPGRSGREILEFQVRYALERDTSLSSAARTERLARVAATVDSGLKSTPWLTFFGSHDPIATAKRVKAPVLILQGADDQQVVATEAPLLEQAFKAGGNRDVTMQVFASLNHLFILQPGGNPGGYATLPTNRVAAEVLGATADWIVTRAGRK